ncbi:hypothetical protein MF672_023595 [Actinomadura sp. ATCC 31491]|uniref:Uncharacterized protein n=1 Tax=Actinomadura luzonensis TaxID=2805427 RepID=A0ABT0FWP0_9ACTN|nr:hypothetical protein [Actinomadura luzonensis]MCK2216761.1 hypothetical protein [Actinomadura luzonensis]
MARGWGWALASLVASVGVLLTGITLYVWIGPAAAVVAVLLAPIVLCGFVVAHDVSRRRRAVGEEEAVRLDRERDHVRRTIDLVMDPELTGEQRAAVLDCHIPRLGRDPRTSPLRERFVAVSELSPEGRALLERARRAVAVVSRSEALRRRLLDVVANEVLLPAQIWEIARLLRAQLDLQREQDRARSGLVTEELRAVLDPQQEALDRSFAAVTARVEGLERYARRVQEADAALRAREALDNNHKYRALLAQTDDTEGMAALAAHGDALEETLARSVREAIEAGQTLAV